MIDKKIILYKAEWCGHCKILKPEWEKFKTIYDTFKNDITKKYDINIDIIEYDGDRDEKIISQHNDVQGFPTIMIEYNMKREEYMGSRSPIDILKKLIPNIKEEDLKKYTGTASLSQNGGSLNNNNDLQHSYKYKYNKYKLKYNKLFKTKN